MGWATLLEILIAFLGPLLEALLRDLFASAAFSRPVESLEPSAGIKEFFAKLRGQTWAWQWGKRAKLAVAERIATKHANQLYQSARFGAPIPALSDVEMDDLRSA